MSRSLSIKRFLFIRRFVDNGPFMAFSNPKVAINCYLYVPKSAAFMCVSKDMLVR